MKTIKSMLINFVESLYDEKPSNEVYEEINKLSSNIEEITTINKYIILFPQDMRDDLDIKIGIGKVSITFSMYGSIDVEKDIPKISPNQKITKLFLLGHDDLRITIEFYKIIKELI